MISNCQQLKRNHDQGSYKILNHSKIIMFQMVLKQHDRASVYAHSTLHTCCIRRSTGVIISFHHVLLYQIDTHESTSNKKKILSFSTNATHDNSGRI